MRKRDELKPDGPGCMAKALDDEMTFVLLGRDPAAPGRIREWAAERVRMGKNTWEDDQITEALNCAATMDRERKGVRRRLASIDRAIAVDRPTLG